MGNYLYIDEIETNSKAVLSMFNFITKMGNFDEYKDFKNTTRETTSYSVTKTGIAAYIHFIDSHIIKNLDDFVDIYYLQNYEWHEFNGDKTEYENYHKADIKDDIYLLKNYMVKQLCDMILYNKRICHIEIK